MSKSPSGRALMILAMTGLLGVGALAYYVKVEPGAAKVPSAVTSPPSSSAEAIRSVHRSRADARSESESSDSVTVPVFVPKISGATVQLSKSSAVVPAGEDPMKYVARACLKEANVDGTRVLSVDTNNGVAVVNFSRGIEDGMGSEQEGTFLKAIQLAFGQFSNIDRVEIDREGSPLASLGNIDLPGPLEVIRPGSTRPASHAEP